MEKLYSPAFLVSTYFPGVSQGNPILPRHFQIAFPKQQRLWPGEIHQHHIGALLQSLEDNFTSVRRDVEVAYVEVRSEVGQLPLGASLQIHEPEILVLNISLQKQERTSPRQKGQMSRPPSQCQGR